MHIVEVRRDGGDLAGMMSLMRGWLDRHKVVPQLFRLGGDVFRLDFASADEAEAFAAAFQGCVVGQPEAQAA